MEGKNAGTAEHCIEASTAVPADLHCTPIKTRDAPPAADTPYAALKMLSSLASPELRMFEAEQLQQKSLHSKRKRMFSDDASDEEGAEDEEEDALAIAAADVRGSRKDKSLGVLSENFLKQYRDGGEKEICLDEAAAYLKVERRRIYDIVNVLEGVGVVERKAKNKYTWLGLVRLRETLTSLRNHGTCLPKTDPPRLRHTNSARASIGPSAKEKAPSVFSDADLSVRKERSLGILAQKFLTMFLDGPSQVVLLDEAAHHLVLSESGDEKKQKTKVRRLYDIANILCSLHLIEKVSVFERGRKSAFRWIGLDLSSLGPPPAHGSARDSETAGLKTLRDAARAISSTPKPPKTSLPFHFDSIWGATTAPKAPSSRAARPSVAPEGQIGLNTMSS